MSNLNADKTKANERHFYDLVNQRLNRTEFGKFSCFLNFGYVPNLSPQYATVQLPAHYLNKNSVKLVLEVIGDCDLTNRKVLDVGCGRGGTVQVIRNFFDASEIVGIDLSPFAIAFCHENHRYQNVTFLNGDAENLPFLDGYFDVVTNIESSHSYPNIEAFYREVLRTLKPGGYFLYTDVFPTQKMSDRLERLCHIGFRIDRNVDITQNVLLSCDEIASSRLRAYDSGGETQTAQEFLGVPGFEVYQAMKHKAMSYRIFNLRKFNFG